MTFSPKNQRVKNNFENFSIGPGVPLASALCIVFNLMEATLFVSNSCIIFMILPSTLLIIYQSLFINYINNCNIFNSYSDFFFHFRGGGILLLELRINIAITLVSFVCSYTKQPSKLQS